MEESGPDGAEHDDLVGLDLDQAQARLADRQVTLVRVVEAHAARRPRDGEPVVLHHHWRVARVRTTTEDQDTLIELIVVSSVPLTNEARRA